MLKKRSYHIFIFLIFSIMLKGMYEYQVIHYLPEMYMQGVSFGKSFNVYNFVIGWFIYITLLPVIFLLHKENISSFVTEFLFFLNFMPILSSYGLNNSKDVFFIFNIFFWILLLFFRKKIEKLNFKISLPEKNMEFSFYGFLLTICILSIFFIYKYNHFHISFDLADVYDIRAEMAGNLPIWFSWIKNCFGNVGFPTLIVLSLHKKNYLFSIFFILLELLMFSVGMDKTYILLIIFSVIIGIFYKSKYQLLNLTAIGIFLIMLLSQLECSFFGHSMLFYLVIRRTFYVPVWVNQLYFDFFNHNEKILFTQNVFVLSKFLPNTYNESIYSLINKNYFMGQMPSPNTGMFAESYMHLGYCGILLFPFLIIMTLQFTDQTASSISLPTKYVISFALAVLISNIPITGGFFSSVWLFFIVFLFLLNSNEKRRLK